MGEVIEQIETERGEKGEKRRRIRRQRTRRRREDVHSDMRLYKPDYMWAKWYLKNKLQILE